LKKLSKSSAALRDAIAKAKKRAAKNNTSAGGVVWALFHDFGPGMRSAESSLDHAATDNVLRNRMKTALSTGDLNVAAMGFKVIPTEIKRTYDIFNDTDVSWPECVDLSMFIAADNELERLGDNIFPDVDHSELEDIEVPNYSGQFRGLETLDLHNNLLKELPLGLRRLQNLHTLKLSGKKLNMASLDIICQIGESLIELRISDNELSGLLPDRIKNLRNLQLLDLHANRITELSQCFQELVYLNCEPCRE
jgi:Leucine-rich repeat (LRR) protein